MDHKLASEYLEKARITPDIGERTRLYRNFQVIFAEELPALPLFYPVYNYGISRQVQGVRIGPLFDTADRFATILEWHLLAARPQRMDQRCPLPHPNFPQYPPTVIGNPSASLPDGLP